MLISSPPFDAPIEAFKMIEPPSRKIGSAFCTVKSSPFTLILHIYQNIPQIFFLMEQIV
jgi:hypothetical protein